MAYFDKEVISMISADALWVVDIRVPLLQLFLTHFFGKLRTVDIMEETKLHKSKQMSR